MAIDSAAKRRSASGEHFPIPDGAISEIDRRHAAGFYAFAVASKSLIFYLDGSIYPVPQQMPLPPFTKQGDELPKSLRKRRSKVESEEVMLLLALREIGAF